MNFEEALLNELDSKYKMMLNGETEKPLQNEPILDYEEFVAKNEDYHNRLDEELNEFNNAIKDIKSREAKRLKKEKDAKTEHDRIVAHRKKVIAKVIKIMLLILPIVIAFVAAFYIFLNKNLYSESASFNWIVTGWAFFLALSLILALIILIKKFKNKVLAIILPIIVIANVVLFFTVYLPFTKYQIAITLKDKGQYDDAFSMLVELDGYKDSMDVAESIAFTLKNEGQFEDAYMKFVALDNYNNSMIYAEAINDEYLAEVLPSIDIGDYVYMGFYEGEPIRWRVLEEKNDRFMLISEKIIVEREYDGNSQNQSLKWDNSSLRKWLNNVFYQDAFNISLQSKILLSDVKSNYWYSTLQTDSMVQDEVYILDAEEVERYLSLYYNEDINDNEECWLRSTVKRTFALQFDFVGADFTVEKHIYKDRNSSKVTNKKGVRPVIWIKK